MDMLKKILQSIVEFVKKPMFVYVLKRIGSATITLFFIITAVFLLLRVMPKERYISQELLSKIRPEYRETFIENTYENLGLNDPVHIQLLNYYKDILPYPKEVCVKDRYINNFSETECVEYGTVWIDLGDSIVIKPGMPVTDFIVEKFPVSFKISVVALFFSYLIGYPMGVIMAKSKDKFPDILGNAYIVMTMAVPGLVFYYVWFIVAIKYLKLPTFFNAEDWKTWITPVWSIVFLSIGGVAMWMRRFMVSELNTDYVKFARSKGLSENRIMFTHVFRNAFVPLIRNIPAALIFAVVGSYFVESLFTIPGSGRLLITALQKVDNPLVQALAIVYSVMAMAAFLLGDVITVFFDPRISLTKNK